MAWLCTGRTLCLAFFLGLLHEVYSLTLPATTLSPSSLRARKPAFDAAHAPVATVYGYFDSYGDQQEDDGTRSAHVGDVFQALAQHSLSEAHMSASSMDPPGPSDTSTASFTVASPPLHGPGLVILTSPVYSALVSPTAMLTDAAPAPSMVETAEHTGLAKNTSIVLGSVVGGIVLFSLCLFFLLSPSIFRQVFCCASCRSRKKTVGIMNTVGDKEKGSNDRLALPSPTPPNGPTISDSLHPDPEKKMHRGEDLEEYDGRPTTSKFSISSSDYVASSRDSDISLVSSPYAVKPTVTFAPGSTPNRPPRPPTADSPTLTESVHLACADKNYMIVTPEPLEEGADTEPRKRHLTPSEFFALHVPGILAGFSLSSAAANAKRTSNSSKKCDRASSIETSRNSQRSSKRDSRHSRTKSAPLLYNASVKKRDTNNTAGDEAEAVLLPGQGSISASLTKHRRSRSTSGWAYPDRPRVKKNAQVNS
ncbi:hypothetical protein CPC08DRAFT_702262 [Agrocybe pediades]|nr:hypothetical protein CPC08DRAFT_702262 [Agrocybe pediades]